MASDDVSPGDMNNPELSESELEALLAGLADNAPADHPVATFFDDIRSAFDSVPPPSPTHALSEYLGVSASTPPPPAPVESTEPMIDLDLVGSAPAGRSFSAMVPAFTAFIGTTVGKVAVGGTIALAAATGAQATGIVDVPGLPDRDATAVVQTADDSSSTSSTSSSSTSTSTTTPAGFASRAEAAQPADGLMIPFTVDGVGSVTVALLPTRPSLVSTTAIADWSVGETSEADNEVEVEFTDGSNRVDVEFEYEDGQLRVRVRDRSTGVENFTWFSIEDGSIIREGQSTDSDDDDSDEDEDDDDDDEDHDSEDHDDDNSGSDDDDDEDEDDDDDDNSGSGSGSDDDEDEDDLD